MTLTMDHLHYCQDWWAQYSGRPCCLRQPQWLVRAPVGSQTKLRVPPAVCWASGFGSWDHTFTQLQPLTAWSSFIGWTIGCYHWSPRVGAVVTCRHKRFEKTGTSECTTKLHAFFEDDTDTYDTSNIQSITHLYKLSVKSNNCPKPPKLHYAIIAFPFVN